MMKRIEIHGHTFAVMAIGGYDLKAAEADPTTLRDRVCGSAKNVFESAGELRLVGLVFGTALPGAPEFIRLDPSFTNQLYIIAPSTQGAYEKNILAEVLARSAVGMKAFAVGIAAESWMNKDPLDDAKKAALDAYRDAHDGSMEGGPGVTEGVFVQLETASTLTYSRAFIDRTSEKPRLLPWNHDLGNELIHEGRFAGLLRRAQEGRKADA